MQGSDLTQIISIIEENSIDKIVIKHPYANSTKVDGSTLLIEKPNLQSARILKNRLERHFQDYENKPIITMERGSGTQIIHSGMRRLTRGIKSHLIRKREGGNGTDSGGSAPSKRLK